MRKFVFTILALAAMSLVAEAMTTKVVLKTLISSYSNSGDIYSVTSAINDTETTDLTDGTGANKANQTWSDRRTLAGGATEDLDMAGSLKNAFGETLTFVKVKVIIVKAASGNTDPVHIGGAAANGFSTMFGNSTDIAVIRPGGMAVFIAPGATGFAVTAGTGDLLKVADSGAAGVTYDVIVIGEATTS